MDTWTTWAPNQANADTSTPGGVIVAGASSMPWWALMMVILSGIGLCVCCIGMGFIALGLLCKKMAKVKKAGLQPDLKAVADHENKSAVSDPSVLGFERSTVTVTPARGKDLDFYAEEDIMGKANRGTQDTVQDQMDTQNNMMGTKQSPMVIKDQNRDEVELKF